jgi:hypothetical protein
MVKRSPKRVARREAAKAKIPEWKAALKREIDSILPILAAARQRIARIEEFLGDDLNVFHEKQSDKPALVVVPGAD